MEKFDAYFLNVDLKEKRTGIEESAMKRTFYFAEELQLNPFFVTVRYKSDGFTLFEKLKMQGKIHQSTKMINLYNFYQYTNFEEQNDSNIDSLKNIKEGFVLEHITGTTDFRVLDDQGRIILYNKRDAGENTVFINHFTYNPNKEMYRRDYYDTYTKRLSKTQHLETGQVKFEVYYTKNGIPCIYKTFRIIDNKSELKLIELLNSDLSVKETFYTEDEFIAYWTKTYFGGLNDENIHYLIVDRSALFSKPIEKLKAPHIKTIFLMHSSHIVAGAPPETGKINKNYEYLLANPQIADAIIIFTERQSKHIYERLGIHENVYIIPHNLEKLPVKVSFESRETNKVIYLGRFSILKNQQSLIDAFEIVLKEIPNATLDLYGEGDTKKRDNKYVKEKGLENNIFIHSYTNDVTSVYNQASLAAFPSKLEGFSLFVLESISHGLPVVSFDIDYGPADMINEGENGFLIPPLDTVKLAEGILTVLKDTKLQKQMSENSYKISEKFTAEKISLLWKKVIEEISSETV